MASGRLGWRQGDDSHAGAEQINTRTIGRAAAIYCVYTSSVRKYDDDLRIEMQTKLSYLDPNGVSTKR